MKRWFTILLCLMLAAALLTAAGGCGGSSSRYTSQNSSGGGGDSGGGGGDDSGGGGDDPGDGGGGSTVDVSDAHVIVLSANGSGTFDGAAIAQYNDYIWGLDPTVDHWQGGNGDKKAFVKRSPAEYFTYGDSVPEEDVYIARDIRYLPDTLKSQFTDRAKKDNENVYVCRYDDSVISASIAAIQEEYTTLTSTPTRCILAAMDENPATSSAAAAMLHSASEAYNNPVLHVKASGTYILQGTWTGQIWFEAAEEDEGSVQVILNGVTVTCSVGPAIVFTDFYECQDTTGTKTKAYDVSSSMEDAGVKVYLNDGTTNTFTGANLPRILRIRPKYTAYDTWDAAGPTTTIDGTDVAMQKKRYKWDGAFHSRVSMVIDGGNADGSESDGSGILKVTSTTCEGLNAEMHLFINGGAITVTAPDDGINVNEDNASVFTMNDGTLNVTSEREDGIDSNGWIILNGGSGTITANNSGGGTGALDAVLGIYDYTDGGFTYNSVVNDGVGVQGTGGGGTPPDGGGNPPDGGGMPPDGGGTPPDGGGVR